jgi:hypothetical protein
MTASNALLEAPYRGTAEGSATATRREAVPVERPTRVLLYGPRKALLFGSRPGYRPWQEASVAWTATHEGGKSP